MEWITILLIPVIIAIFGISLKFLIKSIKHPLATMALSLGVRAMSERFPINGGNGPEKKKRLMVFAKKWFGRWFDDEDLSILIDGLTNELRDARKTLGNVEKPSTP